MPARGSIHYMLEGLLYTVLFVVFLLLVLVIPPVMGMVVFIFLPAIPAVHIVRHRLFDALCFSVVAVAFLSTLSYHLMFLAILLYCTGLGLGLGFKDIAMSLSLEKPDGNGKQVRAYRVFLPGFAGAMVGLLLLTVMLPPVLETSIPILAEETLTASLAAASSLPNMTPEIQAELEQATASAIDMVTNNQLYMLSTTALFATFICFLAARVCMRRLRLPVHPQPNFANWWLPPRVITFIMLTFLPSIFMEETSNWFYVLSFSINQLLLLLCVLLGLAVLDHLLTGWRCPKPLRLLVRPLLLLTPPVQIALMLVGMLDVGFDIRRLRRAPG